MQTQFVAFFGGKRAAFIQQWVMDEFRTPFYRFNAGMV